VDQIATALLAFAAAGVAVWLSVAVARQPHALTSYSSSIGTFFLYGGSFLASVRAIRSFSSLERQETPAGYVEEAPEEMGLEAVPRTEVEAEAATAAE
jgi:hypothetical protein